MDNMQRSRRTAPSQPIIEDTAVYDVNGEKVGEVSERGIVAGTLVVRKGLFFPTDLYIPLDAIRTHDEASVRLNVTKDEISRRPWDQAPTQPSEEYVADDTLQMDETAAPDHPAHADSL